MKVCNVCNIAKHVSCFNKSGVNKDSFQDTCKVCCSKYNRNRWKNKEARRSKLLKRNIISKENL